MSDEELDWRFKTINLKEQPELPKIRLSALYMGEENHRKLREADAQANQGRPGTENKPKVEYLRDPTDVWPKVVSDKRKFRFNKNLELSNGSLPNGADRRDYPEGVYVLERVESPRNPNTKWWWIIEGTCFGGCEEFWNEQKGFGVVAEVRTD